MPAGTMARTITVYFDYRSPFAYFASRLLPDVATRHDAMLDWRPIDLQGLSSFANGMPYSERKRAYVFVDATRAAEYHRIPIQMPKPFPVESAMALRLAVVAAGRGRFPEVHARLFEAAWREQQDVSSDEVLARCVSSGAGDPAAWLAEARSDATGEALARSTREAEEAGVFGVPTMVVDGELFWGIDSIPVLEWRLGGGGA
jgi:2-hydroxychromene-2-carboxylate isomerase